MDKFYLFHILPIYNIFKQILKEGVYLQNLLAWDAIINIEF